jgi:hypothetical protein
VLRKEKSLGIQSFQGFLVGDQGLECDNNKIGESLICCVASDDHDAGSNRCEQENRDAFRPESISVCFDWDQMLRWTAFDRGRPVYT